MNKGFTLVEILVVITLMAVAAAIVIPNFRKFNEGQDLTQATDNLKQALRVAQSSATSGTKCSSLPASGWKVSLKRTLFETIAICYAPEGQPIPTPESRQTVLLPPSISITADSCGVGSDQVDASILFTDNIVSIVCDNGTSIISPFTFAMTLESTNNNLAPQIVSLTDGGLIY